MSQSPTPPTIALGAHECGKTTIGRADATPKVAVDHPLTGDDRAASLNRVAEQAASHSMRLFLPRSMRPSSHLSQTRRLCPSMSL